jgi:hypothetical protein
MCNLTIVEADINTYLCAECFGYVPVGSVPRGTGLLTCGFAREIALYTFPALWFILLIVSLLKLGISLVSFHIVFLFVLNFYSNL